MFRKTLVASAALAAMLGAAHAGSPVQVPDGGMENGFQLTPTLVFPPFDAALGHRLFAEKGCVICHKMNGIGGDDGPPLGYGQFDTPIDAMHVAADLWEKADVMIPMQEAELGEKIELEPEELAAIIAFLADQEEQAKFAEHDIPERILDIIEHDED